MLPHLATHPSLASVSMLKLKQLQVTRSYWGLFDQLWGGSKDVIPLECQAKMACLKNTVNFQSLAADFYRRVHLEVTSQLSSEKPVAQELLQFKFTDSLALLKAIEEVKGLFWNDQRLLLAQPVDVRDGLDKRVILYIKWLFQLWFSRWGKSCSWDDFFLKLVSSQKLPGFIMPTDPGQLQMCSMAAAQLSEAVDKAAAALLRMHVVLDLAWKKHSDSEHTHFIQFFESQILPEALAGMSLTKQKLEECTGLYLN